TPKLIFASSDVVFKTNYWFTTIDKLLGENFPYILMENHAIFGIYVPKMIQHVGWFDERFPIGPHFDSDYLLRAREAGIEPQIIGINGSFTHGVSEDVAQRRLREEVSGALPMNNRACDEY